VRRAVVVAAIMGCGSLASQGNAATPAYDGTYRGEVTLMRGDDSICGKAASQASYTVVNGQFAIVYDRTHHVGVNLEVQNDGSFSGSQPYRNGPQQMLAKASGRIAGNVMDAVVEGQACARRYHLIKS
jgi:hypothetical protein